jgi:hypothetical protein
VASHTPVAARKRTVVARPRAVVDRNREAARKRTVVAPPRTREPGHCRAAAYEHTAVAHSRVVAPSTRVRVATCKRAVLAYSRAVADRTAEVGHNRVAADKPAAASRNHVAIQTHTVVGHNRALAEQGRRAAHNRATAGSNLGLQHAQETRPRRARCRGGNRNANVAHNILRSVAR